MKLADDPKNDDIEVFKHPDVQAFLKTKNNRRICWDCFLYNCYLKQTLSKKHNLNKHYPNDCKGKLKKFKDLKNEPSVATTDAPTATASITTLEPIG